MTERESQFEERGPAHMHGEWPCWKMECATREELEAEIGRLRAECHDLKEQRDWMVDVLVERWHQHPTPLSIHEWMEWTWEQYAAWVERPSEFPPHPQGRLV